ncbi:cytochrome c oxidase assembly factor 1 homolog isoform X1 [Centropristis striata]|uniref:cytochrome c oxidase assembly factor 1 homolog isoform X1 n=1 Tax=Centropristis striata TaxID=184440 RepID=UPI0027E1A905|nr:cytochrome c oxidase assembly factor 1 homolog isoform X1 [Centropristis striata]
MYPQCVTFTEVNAASYSCPAAVAQVKEAKMRVSNSQLQKLTIFTTVLTGAGVGTMYYLMQKKFVESDYHRLALQKLEACPLAMERLGAPPLKVHNIHLTDRNNRIDERVAQIKIPVTGSETGGYLYTSSIRDPDTNRWSVKQAVLQLREGQIIDLLDPPPPAALQTQEGLETGTWH